jgi:tRNA (guanine37-N1)-methyltransferase
LKINVVTLFPEMFQGAFTESLIGRAQKAGFIKVEVHNLRRWSDDPRHQKVDDRPYGGGPGMVIRAEPVRQALKALRGWKVYLSPQGSKFDQKSAERLAKKKNLVLICGHYEGIDERVMPLIDEEVSIGDYVLTGGEIPAMVVTDAVARLVPGVVGDPESVKQESYTSGILDYPHYTRPRVWRGKKVPNILLSGDHKKILKWRENAALSQTKKKRPELLKPSFPLSRE